MTINSNSTKSKTAISIDNQLLKETDSIAQEMAVSRSQVVSSALDEYIRRYRNLQLFDQINDAYSEGMDEDDKQTLQLIKSQMKKQGDADGWK